MELWYDIDDIVNPCEMEGLFNLMCVYIHMKMDMKKEVLKIFSKIIKIS